MSRRGVAAARCPERVVGMLEASAFFLAIGVPVAAFQCLELGPAQHAMIVWGLAGGAVVFGLAGLGLARGVPPGRTHL